MAYAAARAHRFEPSVAGIGGIGVVALVIALAARLPGVIGWGLAVLGAEYALALILRGGTIDGAAPAYATVLLLVGELAYWSLELHVPSDPGMTNRRLGVLTITALLSGGVSALVLGVSELAAGGGLVVEGVGVVAAGAALALVAYLARATRAHNP